MRNMQKSHVPKAGDNDIYDFPIEPDGSLSTDPLEFEESAMRLHMEALETFRLLYNSNRHSPLFYKLSTKLEKLVVLLGGICITKAVLAHQEGKFFPILITLTIDWLREKPPFNFRKCHASYMESISQLSFNRNALSPSIRWALLDKRLIATGEKIEMIKAGNIKVDLSRKEEQLQQYSEALQSMEENMVPDHEIEETAPAGFGAKGCAFSVDRSTFHEPEHNPEFPEESDCGKPSAQNDNEDASRKADAFGCLPFRESGIGLRMSFLWDIHEHNKPGFCSRYIITMKISEISAIIGEKHH